MKTSGRDVSMFSLVLRKGFGMMEGDFVAAVIEVQKDGVCLFQSQVNSEYTKSLTYFTKIIVSEEGEIQETSCECVAGAGLSAGCKHLAATLFFILRYNERGVWQVRKTCTQIPQKWHLPKKQKIGVSPKKAENFSYQVPVYDVDKKKLGSLVYDPRRPQFRNMPSHNDSVRSRVINYRRYEKRRTFGIHGVYAAAHVGSLVHDHDYLRPRLDHQWNLNLIQVNKCRCFDQNLKLSCVRSNVINVFFLCAGIFR